MNHPSDRYSRIRQQTERLCEPLHEEDTVVQPVIDVSPPKWHLGHTTWFFETFVLCHKKNYRVFDRNFNYMFNSYYETVGARVLRNERGFMTRPTCTEIMRYRRYVDEQMKEFLSSDASQPLADVIELGLQHEQQHQELLITDVKYILSLNPLFPSYRNRAEYGINSLSEKGVLQAANWTFPASASRESGRNSLKENYIEIPEGVYSIGYEGKGFFYDNEKGIHKVYLNPFRVLDRLITCGEYLEFMQAGGYENFRYWLAEGWDLAKAGTRAPLYWRWLDNEWYHYTLNGLEKINWHAPVTHVSFYEADAFARWKNKRLLTEFEWEVTCKRWNPEISRQANFLDSNVLHPVARQDSSNQLYGDVWEWTNSAYLAYPGYKQAEGALGEYNGKFMMNQMVLRGGSCATPSDHIRPTYRNFFPPDKRWQFTGIRLAE